MSELKMSIVDYEKIPVPELIEKENKGQGFVQYGADNRFPQLIKKCVQNSPTMSTIVNGYVDYICGNEIQCRGALKHLSENINGEGMTIEELIRLIAYDLILFNGFSNQIMYSRLGTIAGIRSLDFANIRSDKYNTRFIYSLKWGQYSSERGKVYSRFDRNAFSTDQLSQIFYFKNGSRGTYPVPRYIGALKDILTEVECSQYNLNSISRGFLARYIINIPNAGMMTDEQKEAMEDTIREKFCGTNIDANFMLYFAGNSLAGQSEKIEVSKIEVDDANEKFIATKKDCRENIYTAFRCTPNLFGLPTETTGFSSQEYSSSFKLFQKTCVAPLQKVIKQSFEKIFGESCIDIKPFEISFEE